MQRCLINRIEENIYLSDWEGASKLEFLKELNITNIISLGNENEQNFYVFHENINYLKIIIDDSENENISQYFNETNKFIDEAIGTNLDKTSGSILVHCNKGISRSVSIIIAYLMFKGMSYLESFEKIKMNRDFIKPNKGFIQQLNSFFK